MNALRIALAVLLSASAAIAQGRSCRSARINSPRDDIRDQDGRQPNIIYIMADDLGWNDVGFHNPKVRTPNIDALRDKGIELTQSYMQQVCSASRSSFMTGRYPSNNGLQLLVIQQEAQSCLPLEHKSIFQYLKDEGYVTRQVGKWHLGYCDEACLPENRGVDEFRGVRTGSVDYFNWTQLYNSLKIFSIKYLFDVVMHFCRFILADHEVLQRVVNGQPSDENIGTHMTIQDTDDIREMILNHASNPSPLFMWLTPTAPHDPLQVTDEMFNSHDFIDPSEEATKDRRSYLGLVSALDNLVGVTMQSLEEAGMADNTIILFSSDNGGSNQAAEFAHHNYHANNYPLRNGKASYTEGGIRIPTVYFDPRLEASARGTTRDFLVHVTDWLPTFVHLAQSGPKKRSFKIEGIDGVSQLANLGSVYQCPDRRKYNLRKEFLVALSDATQDTFNPSSCATEDAAYRWKNFKLIYGEQYYVPDPATKDTEWPKPEESPELPDIIGDDCHRIIDGQRVVRCLFNVINDPSETTNLFDEHPRLVEKLLQKIQDYRLQSVVPVFHPSIGASNITTRVWNNYLVPRHDYCEPSVYYPLASNDPGCLEV
ncbi:arylsulfatase B-like [Watersipora subatra]|uniref:arylsulfatase B-like n=1 Tax=Watersipora subatra TaxID=2589382 RepID=UPI00355BAEF4